MLTSFRSALKQKAGPLIGAHRGASGQYPENSLPAFTAAIRQRADFLELDVRLSWDGIPVVIHDATIDRTTGSSGPVDKLTAAQLAGYGIPGLDSVLALDDEKVFFNIELKTEDSQPEKLIMQVLDRINTRHLGHRVLISSFDLHVLPLVKAHTRNILTGLLYEEPLPDPVALARRLQSDALHPDYRLADRRLVAKAKANGLFIIPWTVDRPSLWRYFDKTGADGLITNLPAAAVQTFGRANR